MNVSHQFYEFILIESSVIPHPDFPHPGSRANNNKKRRGEKKLVVLLLFVAINFISQNLYLFYS
jgi:hypothetical protein